MVRIRLILDDDGSGHQRRKGRVDDLQVGANRLVDIEAAVERLKQEALPELDAELSTLAQQQWELL
jgi:hypothetical protein